MTESVMKRNF